MGRQMAEDFHVACISIDARCLCVYMQKKKKECNFSHVWQHVCLFFLSFVEVSLSGSSFFCGSSTSNQVPSSGNSQMLFLSPSLSLSLSPSASRAPSVAGSLHVTEDEEGRNEKETHPEWRRKITTTFSHHCMCLTTSSICLSLHFHFLNSSALLCSFSEWKYSYEE